MPAAESGGIPVGRPAQITAQRQRAGTLLNPPPPVLRWHPWVRHYLWSRAARRLGRFCSPRGAARACALLRSGCGRGVLWRWSVGTSPTFLCWTQRPFLKNLFWQLLSSTLIKRQPKGHLRDAAVVVKSLKTVSQPSAPQQARETARAAARAFTSGQFGKTQFGKKKRPDRRASALFPQEAAAQPRVALRNQNSARRRPGKSNTVCQLRARTVAAASTPSNRGTAAWNP